MRPFEVCVNVPVRVCLFVFVCVWGR